MIALVEQYRYTVDAVTVEFPMGGIEEGESPEDAARRELLEEADCSAERFELLSVSACGLGTSRKRCYVFVAHGPTSAPVAGQKDATEADLRASWVPIGDFRSKIRTGKIIDQDTLAAWATYCER